MEADSLSHLSTDDLVSFAKEFGQQTAQNGAGTAADYAAFGATNVRAAGNDGDAGEMWGRAARLAGMETGAEGDD